MQVKAFNIRWDTSDGNGHTPSPKSCGLPKETVLTIEPDEDIELDEQVSDALSNQFGFCHYGFDMEIVT